MISDSMTNASATAAPTTKDFGKKKRNNNKSAKIKQNKLGLRREQWLSQVAVSNKGGKEERSVNRSEKPDQRDNQPVENLDRVRREEDNNGGNNLHHESFMESPSNRSMGGTDSSTNFSGRSSRSSSSSSGFCSGNITEEENADDDDEDDGCVDDWEAVADALAAEEENEKENRLRESVKEQESVGQSASNGGDSISEASDVGDKDAKQDCLRVSSRKQKSNRAWRPDDDLRPQGLPNLAKQLSFPELDKRFSSVAIPSSCPICYEDLDLTDSNFLPCPCGFRLCLFCHKTICDGDGRCPGCRKPYERNALKAETSIQGGGLTIRLARSSSMFCKY